MTMASPRMSFGPSDSPWSPVDGGNYTSWLAKFDAKVSKYCSDPARFSRPRGGGFQVAQDLFESMYSGAGGRSIRSALAEGRMGVYIEEKGGNIALLVFGLLLFLCSIALACALTPKFRRFFARCTGGLACKDRPRRSPISKSGFGWLLLTYKVCALLTMAGMFCLALVLFVYVAFLDHGQNALACNFWQSMRGHYFGSELAQAPLGVDRDWSGTVPEWTMLTSMAAQTDSSTSEAGCPICQVIRSDFESFQKRVNDNVEQVKSKILKETYLLRAVDLALKLGPKSLIIESASNGLRMQAAGVAGTGDESVPIELGLGSVGPYMLETYLKDLRNATDEGTIMFQENLDEQLSAGSPVLADGHTTAKTGASALVDVNYVIARTIMLWDSKVWPLAHGALIAVIVITTILGVLALVYAVGGLVLLLKLQRDTANDRPASPRLTKLLGVMYAVMVVFAGFSALGAAGLFFAGSVGRDACAFVEDSVYRDGEWSLFPDVLLHESVTNRTAMSTVLDTCVKESGDGDVAGALGLRMLMRQVSRNIADTKADSLAKVEKRLDLTFKERKVDTLKQLVENAARVVRTSRHLVSFDRTDLTGATLDLSYVPSYDGMTLMSFSATLENRVPIICAINSLFGDTNVLALVLMLRECLNGIYLVATPMPEVLEALQKFVEESGTEGVAGFCGKQLETIGFCSLADEGIIDVYPAEGSVFDHDRFVPFLQGFNQDSAKVQQAMSFVGWLAQFEYLHATAVSSWSGVNNNFINPGFGCDADGNVAWPAEGADEADFDKCEGLAPAVYFTYAFPQLREKCTFETAAGAGAGAAGADAGGADAGSAAAELFGLDLADPRAASAGLFGSLFGGESTTPAAATASKKRAASSRALPECTFADVMEALAENGDAAGLALRQGFMVANDEVMNFVLNTTIGRFEQMVSASDNALDHFDCQYIGEALREGVVTELCDSIMPSTASLAVISLLLFVFSACSAFIIWRAYHYYSDLALFGEADPVKAADDAFSPAARRSAGSSGKPPGANSANDTVADVSPLATHRTSASSPPTHRGMPAPLPSPRQ